MSNKGLIARGREFARSTNLGGSKHLVSALCDALESVPEPQGEPSDAELLAALYAYEAKAREQDNFPAMAAPRDLTWFSSASGDRMRAALRAANEIR